ncbi:glycosyltransferase family 39 protein [Paraburkholderia sp. CNPSo 3272]|uniref:glycosyltransferase family 39 protein n=1 Tax=Paraburkholderia sp. CNPSo 3272 TaxID=2940931 RepID=UPI0020B67AFC|nr:glycosyltransferase family 39 protein [Paraburkholderia sp. CNPSo 3272]MCP3728753.1 glycosyltransferase family 39 protein [Paraburkholderia sp. CNPSo 3272]
MSNNNDDQPVQPSNVSPTDVAGSPSNDRYRFRPSDFYVLSILLAIFWVGVLRHIQVPGLYMDAVNPDYLAARTLEPEIHNPAWIIPTKWFPILGNLYHGVQTYYLAIPIDAVFGMNIVSVRLGQALFGAVIVALSFAIVIRITGNRLLAFVAAAGLATDIAFIASFRTQNYIILAGEVWLFFSILCLLKPGLGRSTAWRPFLSGVCFGLAAYGYFVFLFFGPAMLWLAGSTATGKSKRDLAIWIGGVVVGMLPYVAGYASLIVALGGVPNAIAWVQAALHNLSPFSSQLSIWGDVINAGRLSQYAMTNTSNELMLLGGGLHATWPNLRLAGMIVVLLCGLATALTFERASGASRQTSALLIALPIVYIFAASPLGTRLWAHHFSVLIPLGYLSGAIAANALMSRKNDGLQKLAKVTSKVVYAVGIVVLCLNVRQQNHFYSQLEETGGVGMATSALTSLANEARPLKTSVVYVFPDWGFFMSFALLTNNQVPYALELSPYVISQYRQTANEIRVAFWKEVDVQKYSALLSQYGIHNLQVETFRRNDGAPAFYLLRGSFR